MQKKSSITRVSLFDNRTQTPVSRQKVNFILWATCLITAITTGCNNMNDYSVSPNHLLTFSTDTLSFDTVFTTIGSTTSYFMIYNKNGEALNINKILLAGGKESNFRINVDGRKGDLFSDIPVWKKDSLYVMVEVTVDPNDKNTPFVIYDSVVFITNGIVQSVLLEAYGQNAHILKGGNTFTGDTTLSADKPYLVYDSIMIPEGVTVSIEEGASFYMHNKAKWLIDGTLKSNGTQEKPVTFRGDRLNHFSSLISYDNIPAQWDGLFFGASSFDNELHFTLIRNGISGLTFAKSTPDRKKMTISNSQIKNMDGNVLWSANCYIEASGTEFSNASKYLVILYGGKYRFSHCTMANYMPAGLISNNIGRFDKCLTLSDSIPDKEDADNTVHIFPLQQACFDNCIIDGDMSADTTELYGGEISFPTGEKYINGHDEQFNYRFNHCVVKTGKTDNERFIDVLFAESPIYIKSSRQNKDNQYDYVFDFRLDEKSAGIGKADRSVSEQYPVDRFGINRLTSEHGPSIGAYEYVPQKKDNEK
ncbi:MAG: hypothetical protein LBC19_15755 [Tannerella sp.]|jgi:hypothetical protein|nr:hypothetical protein [Tannerella sp.]